MTASVSIRPRRRLRYDVYALLLIAILPFVVVLAFPFESLHFHPVFESSDRVTCALVDLSEAEIVAAMDAARSSWQVRGNGVRQLRTDLTVTELPEETTGMVLPERPPLTVACETVRYAVPVLPRTSAAPTPVRIGQKSDGGEDEAAAFPREELLRMD